MPNSKSRISGIALASALLLAPAVNAAELGYPSPLLQPASSMDMQLLLLANQLFQTASSEIDTLHAREQQTRFIPQQFSAYYLQETSGLNLHILVTYRHATPDLPKQKADVMCEAMINWVRFHLGVKDSGVPFVNGSRFGTSSLYQFMTPSAGDPAKFEKDWAAALDKQTVVMAQVGYIGHGGGATAACTKPLVTAKP